jgi:hypothetical protein
VLSNPLRGALLAGVLSLLALAGGPVASAGATVTASHITSPADPSYVLYDKSTQGPESVLLTVQGTTTGAGKVDLRCYYGKAVGSYHTLAEGVEPVANAFSVEVKAKDLYLSPCVLRAVPSGDKEAHEPGSSSPFQGPQLITSGFEFFTVGTINYGYEFEAYTLSSFLGIESAGDCGLDYSYLFTPTSLLESDGFFDCAGALYQYDPATEKRSETQIDGVNAYGPANAHYLQNALKVTIPGAPQVKVTKTFEAGLATIHEIDPLVGCAPETVVPPTTTSCTEFVPIGVQLERTWQTSDAGQVATMTDRWVSTDGAAHKLSALYDQETINSEEHGGAYEFPGTGKFSPIAKGQEFTLPAGPGAIDYKEDATTPGSGDGLHPQGAIVYDRSPSGPALVYRDTKAGGSYNGFEMPYQGEIPASGAYALQMTFIQAYALSEVQALTEAAISGRAPALKITSPANGAVVSTPSITVSGTASDSVEPPAVAVDGHPVGLGAGGVWSTSVALKTGANTIKAVASDPSGFSTERWIVVTYSPPTPPPPPVTHASQVGSAGGSNGDVTFTIACTGSPGTSCEVESTLTTVEKTRHGRLVAVSARRHHPKNQSKRVVVGSSKLTIPAGQRIRVAIVLNSTGKSLLARFGRLPVHLSVSLTSAGHRSTVIAQNLIVKPSHKRRHHRHRHHRHRR